MRARLKFYLKDKKALSTVLKASLHYRGARYWISTGEKIEGQHWIHSAQKCKEGKLYPDGEKINTRIESWKWIIEKALERFTDINPPDQEDLITEIQKIKNGSAEKNEYLTSWIEDFIPRSGRAASTKKRYKTTLNILKAYQGKKKLRFKDIDIAFYRELKTWMEDKPREYSLNFFGSVIKHIKTFMNESEEDVHHGIKEHLTPKFITSQETSDSIYLTEEEILKIHRLIIDWESIMKEFPNIGSQNIVRKIESYKTIRDRFLIGCFTALRVSDFSRLSEVNLKDGLIRIKPLKGSQKNSEVVIPIHWVIKEIISNGFDWKKKVYDTKINKAIKPICKMAGIKGKVSISRTQGGKLVTTTHDKWDLVTTHTARRSGATNMFKAGIPTLAIMMITGHRTEKSFLKYIKISQEENAEMLKNHAFFKR